VVKSVARKIAQILNNFGRCAGAVAYLTFYVAG
jgi:hypothetical protein